LRSIEARCPTRLRSASTAVRCSQAGQPPPA
jgi:hypothetical protein